MIKYVSNVFLKYDKINSYKSIIKKEKKCYINRKQENILHLFKPYPKKFEDEDFSVEDIEIRVKW